MMGMRERGFDLWIGIAFVAHFILSLLCAAACFTGQDGSPLG